MGSYSTANLEAHRRFSHIIGRAMELDPGAFTGGKVEAFAHAAMKMTNDRQSAAIAKATKEIDGEAETNIR